MASVYLGIAPSVSDSGTAVAPGATTTLCSVPASSLDEGRYHCLARVVVTEADETLTVNARVQETDGAPTHELLTIRNVDSAAVFYLDLDGSTAVEIETIGAATALARYTAQLVLTRVK